MKSEKRVEKIRGGRSDEFMGLKQDMLQWQYQFVLVIGFDRNMG